MNDHDQPQLNTGELEDPGSFWQVFFIFLAMFGAIGSCVVNYEQWQRIKRLEDHVGIDEVVRPMVVPVVDEAGARVGSELIPIRAHKRRRENLPLVGPVKAVQVPPKQCCCTDCHCCACCTCRPAEDNLGPVVPIMPRKRPRIAFDISGFPLPPAEPEPPALTPEQLNEPVRVIPPGGRLRITNDGKGGLKGVVEDRFGREVQPKLEDHSGRELPAPGDSF